MDKASEIFFRGMTSELEKLAKADPGAPGFLGMRPGTKAQAAIASTMSLSDARRSKALEEYVKLRGGEKAPSHLRTTGVGGLIGAAVGGGLGAIAGGPSPSGLKGALIGAGLAGAYGAGLGALTKHMMKLEIEASKKISKTGPAGARAVLATGLADR